MVSNHVERLTQPRSLLFTRACERHMFVGTVVQYPRRANADADEYAGGYPCVSPSGTTEPLNGVWGSGPGDVYVVGDSGTIMHGHS